MNTHITKADLKDVTELNALINSAYRGESSKKGWTTEADLLGGIRIDEERLTQFIQKEDSVILKYVDEGNHIIGCVHLEIHSRGLYLGMLTVNPELQAKGIGKAFLKAAEEHAKEEKIEFIYMTVISERRELISWYERHGYRNTGEKKPFTPEDPKFGLPQKHLEFIVMEKPL